MRIYTWLGNQPVQPICVLRRSRRGIGIDDCIVFVFTFVGFAAFHTDIVSVFVSAPFGHGGGRGQNEESEAVAVGMPRFLGRCFWTLSVARNIRTRWRGDLARLIFRMNTKKVRTR
ncbi:hypothetical protein CGRA01v4_05076 [Colletotrichum graminicola]|nr:hypothetical protein CGRA01v4_05076 [Colletotrichum graminicola]